MLILCLYHGSAEGPGPTSYMFAVVKKKKHKSKKNKKKNKKNHWNSSNNKKLKPKFEQNPACYTTAWVNQNCRIVAALETIRLVV